MDRRRVKEEIDSGRCAGLDIDPARKSGFKQAPVLYSSHALASDSTPHAAESHGPPR